MSRRNKRLSHSRWTYIIFFLIASASINSCESGFPSTSARFIVVNETQTRVDSLLIEPDEKPGHWSLDPGDSMVYLSEMEKHPLVDGSYRLSYRVGAEKKGLVFGYFSNGMQSERGTRILLKPDTVLIRHVY